MVSGGLHVKARTRESTIISPTQKLGMARKSDHDEPEDVVGPRVPPDRPDEAHGKADQPGDHHRHQGDLRGDGAAPEDELANGLAAPKRLPEVPPENVLQPVQVLDRVRPVQAQAGSRGAELLLAEDVAPPALAGDRGQGIAGQHAHRDEDEQRDAQQRRDGDEQPMNQVPPHAPSRRTLPVRPSGYASRGPGRDGYRSSQNVSTRPNSENTRASLAWPLTEVRHIGRWSVKPIR